MYLLSSDHPGGDVIVIYRRYSRPYSAQQLIKTASQDFLLNNPISTVEHDINVSTENEYNVMMCRRRSS